MAYKVGVAKALSYDIEEVRNALQEIFELLGYDKENPFGGFIKPGMRVFIKPNWVASRWRASCPHKDDIFSVITHPVVIEVVADFVDLALNGAGEIIIGDNPSIDADFDELMELTGIRKLEKKYNVPCKILDLRPLVCKDLRNYGKKECMVSQPGDTKGYIEVNLGKKSMCYNINPKLFRGVFEERSETIAAHSGEKQLYSFSQTLYDADIYISIPKMKTHHKVGVTLNLKGLVGSILLKNQLVHWRVGFPLIGGDEYRSFWSWLKGRFAKVSSRGAWPGNDTIWRMVVDLYNALRFKERKYFTVVDGIMGGEGNGPFCPYSKISKTLVAGENLLAVDIVTSRLMGFDPNKIPYLSRLVKDEPLPLKDIDICSIDYSTDGFFVREDKYLGFVPPDKWESIVARIKTHKKSKDVELK